MGWQGCCASRQNNNKSLMPNLIRINCRTLFPSLQSIMGQV
uniref:Uncharacterized protein n=1 Tax=Rhizophora mucronata TaxID=61149 RepID=A0A2P2P595_RHIMU